MQNFIGSTVYLLYLIKLIWEVAVQKRGRFESIALYYSLVSLRSEITFLFVQKWSRYIISFILYLIIMILSFTKVPLTGCTALHFKIVLSQLILSSFHFADFTLILCLFRLQLLILLFDCLIWHRLCLHFMFRLTIEYSMSISEFT